MLAVELPSEQVKNGLLDAGAAEDLLAHGAEILVRGDDRILERGAQVGAGEELI
jgi:hypothetical protein